MQGSLKKRIDYIQENCGLKLIDPRKSYDEEGCKHSIA
jgi:hypothetical protein